MKLFRMMLMLATLLGSAAAVHAISPSAASLQALVQSGLQSPGCCEGQEECPLLASSPSWYTQALQQTVAAWQRVRTMCSNSPAACKTGACCEAAKAECKDLVIQVQATCPGGVLGVGCQTAQATPACCCAKACRMLRDVQGQEAPHVQLTPACPFARMAPWGPMPMPFAMSPHPFALPPCPFAAGFAQALPVARHEVQVLPPAHGARVVEIVPVAHNVKHAHLVTPDLEAHCERMTHRGDTILLEGNVMLLCKKHAQPIRIEAGRVLVNMKDGTFIVEANGPRISASSFGVQRSCGEESEFRVNQGYPRSGVEVLPPPRVQSVTIPSPPAGSPAGFRVIQILPVSAEELLAPDQRPSWGPR